MFKHASTLGSQGEYRVEKGFGRPRSLACSEDAARKNYAHTPHLAQARHKPGGLTPISQRNSRTTLLGPVSWQVQVTLIVP